MAQTRWETLTIANNTAVTDDLNLAFGERVVAVETPAVWTAADIVFQVSRDGTTFKDLKDIGATLLRCTTIATGAAELRSVANYLTAMDLPLGPNKMRLRSCNTASAADVNQGGARVVHVLLQKD